jgi:hypothetical protein
MTYQHSKYSVSVLASSLIALLSAAHVFAQEAPKVEAAPEVKAPQIHVVYLGGNDCPPCVAFRIDELPKLKQSPAFSKMQWTSITKTIYSPIPASFFLPSHVKPLRDKLLEATSSAGGSPQTIILVNDEVFDVFLGTRNTQFYERMVASILDPKIKYPMQRCLKAKIGAGCLEKATNPLSESRGS